MGTYAPGVGLVLGLGIDPSEAKAGVAEFGQEFDQSLLSNRQTVMLLNQEMGIHMPRAMSGAVAEMLPNIAVLGGALMGVWAVEKVYEWGKVINDEFFQIYTHADQVIKDLDAAASGAFEHAGREASEMFTHFKTSLAGTFDIAEIDARAAQLRRFHEAYQSLVGKTVDEVRTAMATIPGLAATVTEANAQGLKSLEDVDKKIAEVGQLQFDAHKHMAEVKAKEDKDAAETAKRAAEAAKRIAAEEGRTSEEQYEYFKRRREEAARGAKEELEEQAKLAKVQQEHTDLLRREEGWRIKVQGEIAKQNKEVFTEVHQRQLSNDIMGASKQRQEELMKTWAQAHPLAAQLRNDLMELGIAWKGLSIVEMEGKDAMGQFTHAMDMQAEAVQANLIGSAEQLTAEVAGLIGGRKAQAVVEAIWETAQGIQCLAKGVFSPANDIAAGLHFAAAAEYAVLAGTSGGHHSARGATGGGAGAGQGAPEAVERGGGGAGGSSGGGRGGGYSQTIINVQGVISADTLQQFYAQANIAQGNGLVKVNASTVSAIPASRA
jgi:hypothetical protein